MKTEDIVLILRNLADEIERRGIEEGSATADLEHGVVEVTDQVAGGLDGWRHFAQSGHMSLRLKFRYLDWQKVVADQVEQMTKKPTLEGSV